MTVGIRLTDAELEQAIEAWSACCSLLKSDRLAPWFRQATKLACADLALKVRLAQLARSTSD